MLIYDEEAEAQKVILILRITCSGWEFAPGKIRNVRRRIAQWVLEVVRGTFSFIFQTGVVGRIRQRDEIWLYSTWANWNWCRFNSAAPALFIYLVGSKSEEFSGNYEIEIMKFTRHILPGLLKTKLVSANKEQSGLFARWHQHWLQSDVWAVPVNAARTWSISISWALAPGHSIATFTMSDGGGMSAW